MSLAQSFVAELEQEGATTRRVLERAPAEKFAWKPHAKSMSLGELANHVAGIPGTIAKMSQPSVFDMSNYAAPPAPAGPPDHPGAT